MKRNGVDYSLKILKEQKILIITLLAGLLGGSIYAIAVRDQQNLWLTVNQYIVQGEPISSYEVWKNAIILYSKQLIAIWVLGLWRITFPLSLGVLFFVNFSYGFTISGFLLLYGLKGIGVSVLSLGVQSSFLVLLYLYVILCGQRYCEYEHHLSLKTYSKVLVSGSVVIAGVAIIDGYVGPVMTWLIRQMV